jgi:diaminopimelate decarboxylase
MENNDQGHLTIGGCDTVDLARVYGTPLLVIDEELLRQRCRDFYRSFVEPGRGDSVIYASKAFPCEALFRIFREEGLGLDVVSGGELFIALQANFPPEKIYLHGNNKSPAELLTALGSRVGRIVVDNHFELDTLERLSTASGFEPDLLLRICPGVDAHSHAYIQTGQLDSKFGFTLESGDALEAVHQALGSQSLNLKGLHCHIGSQIFEMEAYRKTARVMIEFMQEIRAKFGRTLKELDLGGGLGVYYTEGDTPPSIADYAAALLGGVEDACREFDFPRPRVTVEPGRSLISPPGTTIYTIGSMKDIPGVRKYVAVDGGMSDNPRPALYQAKYEALLANKAGAAETETVSVTGRCCESGDMVVWDISLPPVESGDLLAVACTGAYTYSMSSNYNGLPRPAVVLVRGGDSDIIIERETYQDLVSRQRVPERLYR